MADADTLLQGGIVATVVSAVTGFLTYRVAMRQTQQQSAQATLTADEIREQRLIETAEMLRKSLLEEIQRLQNDLNALKHQNDDLRQRLDEQEDRIFTLRTRLAQYERFPSGDPPDRRQSGGGPPPDGHDRRRRS